MSNSMASPPLLSSMPYFQQNPERLLERLSRQVFAIPDSADQWLASEQAKHPNVTTDFLLQRLHWLIKKTGNWDVKVFPKAVIPGLSSWLGPITMTQAPVSVFVYWLYFNAFPARMRIAQKREQADDLTKESFDVALRDMVSFALLLFILDPVVRSLNRNIFQKIAGLPLVKSGHLLPYSDMRKQLSVHSSQQLASLLQTPDTRLGMKKAVRELSDRGLSQLGFTELKQAVTDFQHMMEGLFERPDAAKFEGAFQRLQQLDTIVEKAKQVGVETGNQSLINQAFKLSRNYHYPQFLSYYANRFRVPADVLSVVIVAFMAGWLPLALSNFFSMRAVKHYMKTRQNNTSPNVFKNIKDNNPVFAAFQ